MTRFDASSAASLSRRGLIRGVAAAIGASAMPAKLLSASGQAEPASSRSHEIGPYPAGILPAGVRSRFVENGNDLRMHVLEAGFESPHRPAVVLLHGFPELAYSWRKIMQPLAAAGYHVIAPDLRGYGRTGGTDVSYDDDLTQFHILNHVRDILGLVSAFGHRSVAAVAGHDFGSPVAAWCAITRPDVFRSVVLMSGPFGGTASLPFDTADASSRSAHSGHSDDPVYAELARLNPPRKHYQRYYTTREANNNLWHAPQGVHAFLRAYYYMKSADWPGNHPYPLQGWTAGELAKIPHYYIMELDKGMAETVAEVMPSAAQIAACKWLTEAELKVYSGEYGRTGFQGGLELYREGMDPHNTVELRLFSGRTIDVPSLFIAGKSDWGVYQRPGAFEQMQRRACTQFRGAHLVEGAGHWVQQEQPERVTALLQSFLAGEKQPA